jgi:hypothetical protein
MKTSILISSIAALYLLVTFAETPRRHGEAKLNIVSTDNISIISMKRAAMLPVVVITADKKKETGLGIPEIPAEDFGNLKFNVTEYMDADAVGLNATELMPEATETDFSYLKFEISDYFTEMEFPLDEIAELPENENLLPVGTTHLPAAAEFEYLRFDVNDYISPDAETNRIGELPIVETQNAMQAQISIPGAYPERFGYLKFDVSRYYNLSLGSIEEFELPEK